MQILSTKHESEPVNISTPRGKKTTTPKFSLTRKEIKAWHNQAKSDFKVACETNGDMLVQISRLIAHRGLGMIPKEILSKALAKYSGEDQEKQRDEFALLLLNQQIKELKDKAQIFERENILPALSNPQTQCLQFMNSRTNIFPDISSWSDFYAMYGRFAAENKASLLDYFIRQCHKNRVWNYNKQVERMMARGHNGLKNQRAILTNEVRVPTWRDRFF